MTIGVIGDINMDVVPSAVPKHYTIKRDGQMFLDDMEYRLGGQGANFAKKLAELGADVKFFGCLGDDRHGEFLIEELEDVGVRTHICQPPDISTGTTMVVPWEDGERYYLSHIENNAALSYDMLDEDALAECDHIARRGVWFAEEMLFGGNERLLDRGADTSIDLHWDTVWNNGADASVVRERKEAFLDVLSETGTVMGNQEEFKKVTGRSSLDDAITEVHDRGADRVLIHQGPDGSIVSTEAGQTHIETDDVDPQNPVGTGDVYDAAWLYAHRQGFDQVEAARYATSKAVEHLTTSKDS